MRSVVMVCNPTNTVVQPSRVSLALKESQPITMGVAGMPLNRDDVTAV
jgi:hypothetical protein